MIEKLRNINEDILKTTKDERTLNRHMLIKMILLDDDCFFKMEIEDAYAIMRDLGVPENDLKYLYLKLVDINEMRDK